MFTVAAPSVNTRAVARSACFAKRNVHDALVSLQVAGVVSQWTVGNERRYAIDRPAWAHLLGTEVGELPEERAWPSLLAGLRAVRRWLREPELDQLSDYMRASRARDLLERTRPAFAQAGVTVGDRPGLDAWHDLEALIERLLRDLSSGDPFPRG